MAVTSSKVMPGRVVDDGVGTAVAEHLLGHERRRPHDDVGPPQPVDRPHRQQVGRAGPGADEADHRAPPARTGGTISVARYEAGRSATSATGATRPPGSPSSSPSTAPSSRSCSASVAATFPIWAPPL